MASDRGNVLLRTADRIVGIPLVAFLGLFVRKKTPPVSFSKAAFLATAAIGDTLLISAVLKDFLEAYPRVILTVFCGKSNEGTFKLILKKLNMDNVKLVTIPVSNPFKSIRMIRKEKYPVWIDFGPWPRINALLSFFAKSRYKVGFKSIKQYRHFVYNQPIDHLNTCHEIENLRRLLTPFEIKSESLPYLGEARPDKDNPYIVVHMFPSGYKAYYKEWSDAKWIRLINFLTENGWPVKLTGAPKDLFASERIKKGCSQPQMVEILAGKTNLEQVGDILQKALLVISVNTGIMHMAAAYNQKLVALHGPTSELRWGPLCSKAINCASTSPYAGCLHLGFEYNRKDPSSMETISADDVISKVFSFLPQKI